MSTKEEAMFLMKFVEDMHAAEENDVLVAKCLDAMNWSYKKCSSETEGVYTGKTGNETNEYAMKVVVDADSVQTYTKFPASVGKYLPEMAEFVTRVNSELKFGKLEINYEDATLSMYVVFPMDAVKADPAGALKYLVMTGARVLDKYACGISKLLDGKCTAEEAAMGEVGVACYVARKGEDE